MSDGPKVGDECKADFIEEGEFVYGKITEIDEESGTATTDMDLGLSSRFEAFIGDIPTRKVDGIWIFDAF